MNVEVKPAAASYKLKIEKDIDVPMRDGARLKADVFRPDHGGKFPAILNLGPYQKDKLWVPPPQLEEKATPSMNWETVTPEWWVPRGYAAVRVDGRGSGKSPGQCEPWSLAEAIDFYDAIEWAAAQPWCNGKVGLSGISYFAINQWFVANLQPPSLKAIIPWEGFADIYRDALFHGGILSVFMTNWVTAHLMHHVMGRAAQHQPDGWQTNTLWHWLHHNLDSGVLCGSQAQWDKITVPFMSVGNWTGFALHLRGNTEAFMRSPSKHKKLRIHNGSHVHPFYTEEGKRDQLRFLDYWLKGIDNGVMDEPPVKLAIRHGKDRIEWRHENEWPLKRTQWTKYYFDISTAGDGKEPRIGSLVKDKPAKASSCTYPAFNLGTMGSTSAASSQVMGGGIKPGMGIALSTPPMIEDTEITGPLAATLHVSSESEDMDLFLTLRHFDADGNEIMETGQQGAPVPVAKGWLRASHRELDPELSLPYRPYHKHTRRLWLKPGEIVKVDVEIWPTSMVFRKGHRIQLDVQPRDGVGSQSYLHYHADYNTGTNTIYAGGEYESYLLLPVIPEIMSDAQRTAKPSAWDILARADVLSGLLFIAIAVFGLWASRNYPVGTALRMGTGYVPRLLCWLLLGLGVIVLVQGVRTQAAEPLRSSSQTWRAVLSVTLSLLAFGLSIERLGLVLAILLLTGIGALATRTLRPLETAIAALALIVLSWAIFIFGLGLTIPVWPEW